MTKRIILGDDHLDYARKAMPDLPDAEIEYVDNPFTLVERVQSKENQDYYDLIISDCDYGENAPTGIDVFRYMKSRNIAPNTRKVLWTGLASDPEVKKAATGEIEVELYAKSELNAILDIKSEEPEQKEVINEGRVLVYASAREQPFYNALKKVVNTLFGENVKVSSELEAELKTGNYRLAIDTSTLWRQPSSPGVPGVVEHDMKYFDLNRVPKVECVHNVSTLVADIAKIIAANPDSGE